MVVSPLIAPTIKLEDGSTVDSVGTSTGPDSACCTPAARTPA